MHTRTIFVAWLDFSIYENVAREASCLGLFENTKNVKVLRMYCSGPRGSQIFVIIIIWSRIIIIIWSPWLVSIMRKKHNSLCKTVKDIFSHNNVNWVSSKGTTVLDWSALDGWHGQYHITCHKMYLRPIFSWVNLIAHVKEPSIARDSITWPPARQIGVLVAPWPRLPFSDIEILFTQSVLMSYWKTECTGGRFWLMAVFKYWSFV